MVIPHLVGCHHALPITSAPSCSVTRAGEQRGRPATGISPLSHQTEISIGQSIAVARDGRPLRQGDSIWTLLDVKKREGWEASQWVDGSKR